MQFSHITAVLNQFIVLNDEYLPQKYEHLKNALKNI